MEANREYEIDLREIFYIIRRKLAVIILSGVIVGIIAGLISYFALTPMYTSTSKVYILTQSTSITSLADIQMGTSLTSDYMELIKSRPVVDQVIENIELDMEYEGLLRKLSVSNPADTRILKITITDEDPRMAKRIADDFAAVSQKQISEIMKTDEPSIVEKGHVAENPESPNKKLNILIGMLLGLMISTLAVIIKHLTDDTIKTPEDVAMYLELNTLAIIPLREEKGRPKEKKKKRKAAAKNVERKE